MGDIEVDMVLGSSRREAGAAFFAVDCTFLKMLVHT